MNCRCDPVGCGVLIPLMAGTDGNHAIHIAPLNPIWKETP